MTKKITTIGFVRAADGLRVTYAYSKLDDAGNTLSANNRGSYVDDSAETAEMVQTLQDAILAHIEEG